MVCRLSEKEAGMEMRELGEVGAEVERTMGALGITGRHVEAAGCVGYEYRVPTTRGVYYVRSFIRPPQELQAVVSGRIRRRMKKRLKKAFRVVKKVVKSKAFKALGSLAKTALSAMGPQGQALSMALSTATKAGKAVANARKRARVSGDDTYMRALPAALAQGAAEIREARRVALASWQTL